MKLRRISVLLAALALLGAACGNDDDAGTTVAPTTTAAATTTQAPTTTAAPATTAASTTSAAPAEPIKLMVIHEGSAGVVTPEIPGGAQAAAAMINEAGGINGRMIEIVVCDTANDPNTAAGCGRTMVEEGFAAAVGNLTTHSGEFLPLLEENKIASIGLIPAGGADFSSGAAFPYFGGVATTIAGLAGFLIDAGATKISVARIDIAAGAAIPQFATAGLARFGAEPPVDVPVPIGAPDMAPYVAAATANGEDGVIVATPGQDALNFVLAALQTDPDLKIGMISTEINATVEALGDLSDGIILSASTSFDNPDYLAAMDAVGAEDTGGNAPTAYTAVLIFAEVAKGLDVVTGPAVFDALSSATDIDVGMTPPLQFVQGGVFPGIPRVFGNCAFPTEIREGERVRTGDYIDTLTGQPCG